MKRKELLKRWGIVILSAMVMAGTAAAPLHTVYASEAGEGTSGGENGEGGGKSDPGADSQSDPEPEGGQAGSDDAGLFRPLTRLAPGGIFFPALCPALRRI